MSSEGQAWCQDCHDCQSKDQRRDSEHQVGQPVDEVVPPTAPVPGRESEANTDDGVDQLRHDADRQRDTSAVKHPAVDIATLRVRPEPDSEPGGSSAYMRFASMTGSV